MAENQKNRRRQRRSKAKQVDLAQLVKKRFRKPEQDFKPDPTTATWLKTTRLTQQQRLRLTKWALYILTCILCLVVQDVIVSKLPLFGACVDLPICAILLITVLEGSEVGSVFVLIASIFYYFSGNHFFHHFHKICFFCSSLNLQQFLINFTDKRIQLVVAMHMIS